LVDGNQEFRAFLKEFIELEGHARVIGEARNGPEAVRAATVLRPDYILIDAGLPDGGGLRTAKEIKKYVPSTGIALVTEYAPEQYATIATESGIDAVLHKDFLTKELPRVLKEIRAAR
jgi:DNA-binding NarL/FixJ family response regulator